MGLVCIYKVVFHSIIFILLVMKFDWLKQSHVTFIKASYFPLNNIVFPSQQYRISLIRNSQDLTLWSYNGITPEMFRNINFVNKDGQQISFGRFHQNVGMVEKNIHFPCISEIWKFVHPRNSHISRWQHDFSRVNKFSYLPYAREINYSNCLFPYQCIVSDGTILLLLLFFFLDELVIISNSWFTILRCDMPI